MGHCTGFLGRWNYPQRRGTRPDADEYHRFATLLHALDQVGRSWRCLIPEHDEDVSSLGHLVIAPHAGGLPKTLPVRPEALMAHGVLPGPAVAEQLRTAGAAREDLRDAMAIRRQHLAEPLVVGERMCTGDDNLHEASLLVMRLCGWLPGTTL